MIASVQMVGLFIGNFVSGQVADAVGRKIPLFSSLAIILVFNIMAFLSTSWVMFAVARTAIGRSSKNSYPEESMCVWVSVCVRLYMYMKNL